jgi:hypothetical protein
MATSTVSRLESGARGLALAHLPRLAAGLRTDVDTLLGRAGPAGPEPASDGKRWWPLVEEQPDGLRAYRVEVPAGLREPVLGSHEGHLGLLVLRGRLRVVTQARDAVLAPGEAAELSTWVPHWIGAVDGPADALAVFSASGAPIRVRDVVGPPPA